VYLIHTKTYVSLKHNNLLHKITLTATCFDSNESSSGHPNELIQDIPYIRIYFEIPVSSKVNGNDSTVIIKVKVKVSLTVIIPMYLIHTRYKFHSNTTIFYTKLRSWQHVSTLMSHHQAIQMN